MDKIGRRRTEERRSSEGEGVNVEMRRMGEDKEEEELRRREEE